MHASDLSIFGKQSEMDVSSRFLYDVKESKNQKKERIGGGSPLDATAIRKRKNWDRDKIILSFYLSIFLSFYLSFFFLSFFPFVLSNILVIFFFLLSLSFSSFPF